MYLDIRNEVMTKQVSIVLLTAVAWVSNHHSALSAVTFFQKLSRKGISVSVSVGRWINGIVGYELDFPWLSVYCNRALAGCFS